MERLVSIVLPVYNGEKYLRESIDSVLAQTYKNWELLVLDDCSTDSTPAIVNEYITRDTRIRYYRNEHNLKLPRNLNKGFALTRGEYLTWTSDDNRYKPNAIKRMVEEIEKEEEIQFVFASCRIIDANGNEIEYMTVHRDSPRYIVGSNCVGACFMYTRKVYESVGDYNPEYILVEDFEYWQRISMRFKAVGIEEILYEYRVHDGALTSTMKKNKFYKNQEKMLLENRNKFGKLDIMQKYVLYSNLNKCRIALKDINNPYKKRFRLYSTWYFFCVQVPKKIKKMTGLGKK